MITVNEIFEYAKLKGLKINYYSECFNQKKYSDDIETIYLPETHIGIQINSYTWFWWKFDAKDEKPYLFFNQRFNAGSGHTIRTFKTGFNMECKIKQTLNNKK